MYQKQEKQLNTTVVTKATLDEEIKEFKSIVRHIFKHEVRQGEGNWIRMDNRSNLRRLNDLGVFGHQPAIKVFCQMTKDEKARITENILKQKIANNRKAEATFVEHRERERGKEASEQTGNAAEKPEDTILIRIARIAFGAPVRWKREIREDKNKGNSPGTDEADQNYTQHSITADPSLAQDAALSKKPKKSK